VSAVSIGHDVADLAARHAVGQILPAQLRRGGNQDNAQLHAGEHGFPQGRHVGEHEQQAIAAPGAEPAEQIGEPAAARRHVRE
jgi:hypothetical protein